MRAESGGSIVESFSLPDQDTERDRAYASRLDLDTRVRRRLYEGLFAAYCRRLKKLDGLPLDRNINNMRDAVWKVLAARGLAIGTENDGVVVDEDFSFGSEGGHGLGVDGSGSMPEEPVKEDSTRWEAENSFA